MFTIVVEAKRDKISPVENKSGTVYFGMKVAVGLRKLRWLEFSG